MMSAGRTEPPQVSRKQSSPSPPSHSPHIPQLRLAPTRQSSEPLALVNKPSSISPSTTSPSTTSTSTTSSISSRVSVTPPVSSADPPSEPLSLVSKPQPQPAETAENLTTRKPERSPPAPVRPEIGSIRVRPAEALSPASLPPSKRIRESPSPRQRPPVSSPLPPQLTGSLASLYSSPYLAAFTGSASPQPSGAPCTDPLCRDVSCPTYQMRAAQAAHMMALTGLSLPPGYPYSMPSMPSMPPMSSMPPMPSMPSMPPAPGLGGLVGLPPSMLGYPGAPSLPGLLPPSFLGSGPPPVSVPSSSASSLAVGSSPFSCNWVQGGNFCGRRFNSSEELMAHLRTHTANMGDSGPASGLAGLTPGLAPSLPPSLATSLASGLTSSPSSALALLQAQAAQLRGQSSPTPPATSPQSLAPPPDPRYNPYLRPALPQHQQNSIHPMLASLYGSPRQLPVLP